MNDEGRRILSATELDETAYPEFRDRIRAVEAGGVAHVPRRYDGHPAVSLPPVRARRFRSLDATLATRRSRRDLIEAQPPPRTLSRILWFSHGVHDTDGRGPTPSSGKLCALELYLAPLAPGWLEPEVHHFDRAAHCLRRVAPSRTRDEWGCDVPSLGQTEGGAILWIVVGDVARVALKYGPRAARFLLLEAGHLMQNLCLVSESLGHCTVPLGGFFERTIAAHLRLHRSDAVLYVGVLG